MWNENRRTRKKIKKKSGKKIRTNRLRGMVIRRRRGEVKGIS